MKKSEFARLCQVSPPMVSKYAKAGLIASGPQGVDALRSLQRLRGHLDEAKRTAAIIALGDGLAVPAPVKPAAPPPDDPPADEPNSAPDAAARAARVVELERQRDALQAALSDQTEKRRKEKIEADLREIELMRARGEVCSAAEVRRAVEDTCSVFWAETTRRVREDADIIAAALQLDEFRARKLRDLISARLNRLREDYSGVMMKLARELAGDDAPTRGSAA